MVRYQHLPIYKLTAAQITHARALLGSGEDGRTVARSFGVARSTLYAALKAVA